MSGRLQYRGNRRLVLGLRGAVVALVGAAVLVPATMTMAADPLGPQTLATSPAGAAVGQPVTIIGASWPASVGVSAFFCGNNAATPATDCAITPAGQATTGPDGSFSISGAIVAAAPTPCPCAIRVVAADGTTEALAPFDIQTTPVAPTAPATTPALPTTPATTAPVVPVPGATAPSTVAPTTPVVPAPVPPVTAPASTVLQVDARIEGSGPFMAYLGGSAERELTMVVTNPGTAPVTGVGIDLTVGKGQNPDEPLVSSTGAPLRIEQLGPGQSIELTQPFTINGPAFGEYRVRAQFNGVQSIELTGGGLADGTQALTVSTSTYPWVLVLLGWLLLQIPLLSLYRRRGDAALEPDPLLEQLPIAGEEPVRDAVPVPAMAGAAAAAGLAGPPPVGPPITGVPSVGDTIPPVPTLPPPPAPAPAPPAPPAPVPASAVPPPPPGFDTVAAAGAPAAAAAVASTTDASALPTIPPVPAPPAPPAAPAAPTPVQSPVFGVNDLRALMEQPPGQP